MHPLMSMFVARIRTFLQKSTHFYTDSICAVAHATNQFMVYANVCYRYAILACRYRSFVFPIPGDPYALLAIASSVVTCTVSQILPWLSFTVVVITFTRKRCWLATTLLNIYSNLLQLLAVARPNDIWPLQAGCVLELHTCRFYINVHWWEVNFNHA